MTLYALMCMIVTLAAVIGYLNLCTLRLPTTIAIMSGSLLVSLLFLIIGNLGFEAFERSIEAQLLQLDFHQFLMQGLLSFLLFAGALNVDMNQLRKSKWEIGLLATGSTIASTFLIGFLSCHFLAWFGIKMRFIECLLFGALISPTDPIAVLAIFKQVGAPKQLDVTVSGESLFNDGVGIVMFLTFYHIAYSGQPFHLSNTLLLFSQQAIGGVLYGILLGLVGYHLIKSLSNEKVEILITLAMTTGGYALANNLGLSGPLAMVTAGIFIGNKGQNFAMPKRTRERLDTFWELVDEILNAILFLLMGLELLVIKEHRWQIVASVVMIPLVLIVRYICVAIPISLFKLKKKYCPHFINILVWGGLRGGLAVALALSLPNSIARDTILTMTYAIVIFSVIIQGLTVKPLVAHSMQSCKH